MEATQANNREEVRKLEKKPLRTFQLPGKGKKKRRVVIALLVVGLAAGWFFLRSGKEGGGPAERYLLDAVQPRDLTVSVSGTGTVTPIDAYRVRALVAGAVLEAPFEEGDKVEKDDLLYRVDAGDAELGLRQAQLTLRQARTAYEELETNLTPCASADGVVQQVCVRKGDLVSPGAAIAEVADASVMELTLPFQSGDAAQLSPGQVAQVTIAGTMETLSGTVVSVSSAELVGKGGALVRQVKIKVKNPGALTAADAATAVVGEIACADSGNFEEVLRQTVVAQTSGQVTDVLVTAGSRVSAGTPLVTLGGASVKTALEDAAAALESAQLSLQRSQEALKDYTITAPIEGTVIEKNFKTGDKMDGIESGDLAVIYDLSRMKLEMNVNELDIGKIAPGQAVEITAGALPGQVFQGVVDRVSINGTTTNGFTTYPVTITVEEYGALKPGMNVSATILGETVSGALTVPVSAVSRGNTVLVAPKEALGEDGTLADPSRLEERTVALGASDDRYIQITDGLAEGELVAYQDEMVDIQAGG